MRLPALLAVALVALPAAAQTPLTGTNAPATSAPPLAGTAAQPGTPPATMPSTTPPATSATPPGSSLPSTPAQPTTRSSSHSGGRAGSGHRLTQAQRFEQANTTHDGKLTLDQAKAAHMNAVVRDFDAIDKTHKGYVTQADIRDHRRAVRAARKAAAASKS